MLPRRSNPQRIQRGRAIAALIKLGWNPPPMTNKQAGWLLDDMDALPSHSTLDLAPRQRQVLVSMADGATIKTIAAELGLAPETVKRTSRETRRKLGARNTTHAVAIALREGLIE